MKKPQLTTGKVLGILAVVLVLGMSGSAVAGSLVTSAKIKNRTIRVIDINPTAITAIRGNRPAYATVSKTGVVSNALRVTQANVTHPGTGKYCFKGLPFTPRNAQVTMIDPFPAGFSVAMSARVQLGSGIDAAFGCPSGSQVLVVLRTHDPIGVEDEPFQILLN